MTSWVRRENEPAWMMGVLNCTPDSFSDGSSLDIEGLIQKAKKMVSQGADIIDVGGESTRPNANPVSEHEEMVRIIPVIEALTDAGIKVSVDSMKATVIAEAIEAGAEMVNDVSALQFDAESLEVVAEARVNVCLMHMKGSPQTMQQQPYYDNVISEVAAFFEQRIEACTSAGIQTSAIILDPGIGFGKRLEDNLQLITHISHFKKMFEMPILLGVSRKSFLGSITGAAVQQREIETAVASGIGIFCGADMIRVHDCAVHHKTRQVSSRLAAMNTLQQRELCDALG